MIIGFLARKGSGKDTCADFLVNNYSFDKMHFAQPIKDACRILFNFDDDQLFGDQKDTTDHSWGVSPREVLQYLGTDIFRKDINKLIPGIEENFWVKLLEKKYLTRIIHSPGTKITIADVRFQNEIDKIHELGGYVIKIIRPNQNANTNTDVHESEKNIDLLEGDFLINNDKTKEEMFDQLTSIMAEIIKNKK